MIDKIPKALRDLKQWIVWKIIDRKGELNKVPFQVSGKTASSTDAGTWSDFHTAHAELGINQKRYAGLGFVFSRDDPFCGIDLDGCRDKETGEVAQWAKDWIVKFDSYSEVSPSKTGVKIFIRAKSPFDSGRKVAVADAPKVSGKTPGVEMYDWGRYFAVTGLRLSGVSADVEERQQQLAEFAEAFWPKAAEQQYQFDSTEAVVERARKYVAKLPPSVSGQGGHNAAFHAACVLVLGFGLDQVQALGLMREYNQTCQPAWSERELEHKVKSASKTSGPRNYLRDTRLEDQHKVRVPKYEAPPQAPEVRITTLDQAARDYLRTTRDGTSGLLELGLPEVDVAIGGGIEAGEMVILAARPSHGKSAVALQCIHHVTRNEGSAVIISEEMSARSLGKRAIQFASDVPEQYWHSSNDVERHIDEHFEERGKCYVVESVRTAERAAEAIEDASNKYGIRLAVVDYAQLLVGRGKSRYEQVTNTSVVLRQVASATKVPLLVLCQMSRAIESRTSFLPAMGDLKDSGQLEQDADVILFLCWPHRLDPKRHPNEFLFFVGKNRNRAIGTTCVKCLFKPSRQMFLDDPAAHPEYNWDPDSQRQDPFA